MTVSTEALCRRPCAQRQACVWQGTGALSQGMQACRPTLGSAQAASGDEEGEEEYGLVSGSDEEIDEDDDTVVLTPTGKTAAQLRRWGRAKPWAACKTLSLNPKLAGLCRCADAHRKTAAQLRRWGSAQPLGRLQDPNLNPASS